MTIQKQDYREDFRFPVFVLTPSPLLRKFEFPDRSGTSILSSGGSRPHALLCCDILTQDILTQGVTTYHTLVPQRTLLNLINTAKVFS